MALRRDKKMERQDQEWRRGESIGKRMCRKIFFFLATEFLLKVVR